MRILAIRGQNLASLARAFEVDLAAEPLDRAGIFAITGPVGAGKSTLLDALCLSLFDRTPRLAGRGGAPVADGGEDGDAWLRAHDPRTLLRRDAAAGYAEVDFIGRDGVRYRARWSVRRARHRPDGRIQDQELLLRDLERDVVVSSGRRSEVLAAIQQRLGLDFAQFCRSVLLAQGEFAAFLRASAEERAKLLEALTGADVYRRLSKAAHERARAQAEQVGKLQSQIDANAPMASEIRGAAERRVAALTQELKACQDAVELADAYVQWHERAAELRDQENLAVRALDAAIASLEATEEQRQLLGRRQRALIVVPRLEQAQQARRAAGQAAGALQAAQQRHRQRMAAARAALENLQAALRQRFGAAATAAPPALVREFPSHEPLLRRWQEATAALAHAEQSLAAATAAVETATKARDQAAAGVESAMHDRRAVDELLARAQATRDGIDWDALEGRRQELRKLQDAAQRLADLAARWSAAVEAFAAADQARQDAERALADAAARATAARQHSEQAIAAREAVRGQREEAHRRHGLDALRERLVAGEPCPLCGAREHDVAAVPPLADLAVLDGQLARFAEAAVAAERAAAQAIGDEQAARRDLARCRRDSGDAAAALAAAAAAFAATGEAAADPAAAQRLAADRRAVVQALADSLAADEGTARRAIRSLDDALAASRAAAGTLHAAGDRLALAERARNEAQAAHANVLGKRSLLAERLADLSAEIGRACVGWPPGFAAIAALPGDRLEVLASLHRLHVAHVEATAAVEEAAAGLARAHEAHAQAEAAAVEAEHAFAAALAAAGVECEDVEAARRLGPRALEDEAKQLRELELEVERRRVGLQVRAGQRKQHEQTSPPSLDADEARAAQRDARASAAAVGKELDEVRARLLADDLIRRHRDELAPRLGAAQREAEVWAALDALIGSSAGDRFAVFAQQLTLELLLVEANRRLAELARRYRLRKNPAAPLDFLVADLDLGGTLRSVQSLSGGETFLVSLALALALATLAAPKSRVETLFLDEGFGTLDAQNLEIALGALDSLQATGCQVGVISHVDGIAERIGAEVVVHPEGGGRSRVFARAR
jgi:exonuclease SbcC